jgi:hypothetical protein
VSARTARQAIGACHTSYAEYEAINAIRWSDLRGATKSAREYKYLIDNPKTPTPAMLEGSLVHTAVFEADRLPLEYAVWDLENGNRNTKAYKDFVALHEGSRTVVSDADYQRALDIRDAVRSHPAARKLLRVGSPECTLTWTDSETGLFCKARLDWLAPRALVDIKTTGDIAPRTFGRHFAKMLWHCQLAFYSMGLRANGINVPVKFIVVEADGAHDVAVRNLPIIVRDAGEDRVRAALRLVAACRSSRKWPGAYLDEEDIDFPVWELPSENDIAGMGIKFA